MPSGPGDDDAKKDELADALSRIEHDAPSEIVPPAPLAPPPPPASAAEFRRSSRPPAPPGSVPPPPARPAAPQPLQPPRPPRSTTRTPTPTPPAAAAPRSSASPQPPPPPAAKAKPARPERPRPDRPTAPPTTQWSDDEAAQVAAHYEPLSEVVDDDDVVMAPAPDPAVFMPRPPPQSGAAGAPAAAHGAGIARSLAFRRTVIPVLLTCGALLIGIGLLRWVGGEDSIFTDMTIPVSAGLCGTGMFLLLVAFLNMLQVKSELDAAARRRT